MWCTGMTILPVYNWKELERIARWDATNKPLACPFPSHDGGLLVKISVKTIAWLEPEEYDILKKNTQGKVPDFVYFNKGL
ncbi:Protein of unknown function [Gryllus bimaculatus]|nr:Protein of unknown function [Gryllus bimaculatus]